MYYKLFNKLSDLEEEIKQIQLETEEMYIAYTPVEKNDDNKHPH